MTELVVDEFCISMFNSTKWNFSQYAVQCCWPAVKFDEAVLLGYPNLLDKSWTAARDAVGWLLTVLVRYA